MGRDRRREERIELEAPVTLLNGTGVSRDFGASTIYFVTEQFLPRGCPVTFQIRLDHACLDQPLRLLCRGQVMRVETRGEKFGIAASGLRSSGYFS